MNGAALHPPKSSGSFVRELPGVWQGGGGQAGRWRRINTCTDVGGSLQLHLTGHRGVSCIRLNRGPVSETHRGSGN